MDVQSKSVPPELLYLILEHLEIDEQFKVRRVNKKFKDVVENSIWPSTKVLDLKYLQDWNRKKIHHRDWELMLSHMPKLEIFSLGDSYEKRMLSRIVTLLSKYCQSIKIFETENKFKIEYLKKLSKHGIYETSLKLNIDFDPYERSERLDDIDPKSTYRINKTGNFSIPGKYLDRIYAIEYLCASEPYLPNLREVHQSGDLDESESFSEYHQQLIKIDTFPLVLCSKLHYYINLEELWLYTHDFDIKVHKELEYVTALERYLKSDASCHLKSLRINLMHEKNSIQLIETLYALDRPRKWKRLEIKHDDYFNPTSLDFKEKRLTIVMAWKNRPVTWVTNWTERFSTPIVIDLTYNNMKMTLSNSEFDKWKQWFENYASKHRNKNLELLILPIRFKRENYREPSIKKDNWSIVHLPNLISEKNIGRDWTVKEYKLLHR